MKYKWETMTEDDIEKAIEEEIKLYTHNGTTKDDLFNMLEYLFYKIHPLKAYEVSEGEVISGLTASDALNWYKKITGLDDDEVFNLEDIEEVSRSNKVHDEEKNIYLTTGEILDEMFRTGKYPEMVSTTNM